MHIKQIKKYDINKSRFIKIIVCILCLIISAGAVLFYLTWSHNNLPSTSPKISEVSSLTQSSVDIAWPNYGSGAIGAVGFDDVLAEYGDQNQRPIASISKIITALVVLQAKPLVNDEDGPSITLTENDLAYYNEELADGAAVEPVIVGNSITEKQALEIMLLPSAANYSKTLAVWAYGSMEAYVKAANDWLAKNGLTQTSVADSSGMSSENVSTPSNLIKLGKLALENSSLLDIVSTKQITVSGIGTISNGNSLLGSYGINGIKTGTTGDAGACMLFSSIITVGDKKVTIIGTLLAADNRAQQNSDVIDLVKSATSAFHLVKLSSKNQQYGTYTTKWGQTASLISAKDVEAVVWNDTQISATIKANAIKTAQKDSAQGEITFKIGDKTIKQALVLSNSITEPDLLWRLKHLF